MEIKWDRWVELLKKLKYENYSHELCIEFDRITSTG